VSPLTLTVLGCDGSHAGPAGAGSGYLVRDWGSGTAVWLDAGPGTFAALQHYIDPLALSAIVLTHEHDDHWSDVHGFLTAARWTMGFTRDPIPVLAAPGVRRALRQDPEGFLEWRDVGDGDSATIGGLELHFSRTDHPPVTVGVLLRNTEGSVGYSADSGPGWSMAAWGRDVDLALCEATYTEQFENGEAGHMSGTQAGRMVRDAGARRLVITHRWAKIPAAAVMEEATAAFGGRVDAAEPGRGFSL
jgi:ribonuclease BN (tRNA processing enzyme)